MWVVKTTGVFNQWFSALDDVDRAKVLAVLIVLGEKGPLLGRPYADAVNGSSYRNMKELRVQSRGRPIRIFFAFDPDQSCVLLCGEKKTENKKRFYEIMVSLADREFAMHLNNLEKG